MLWLICIILEIFYTKKAVTDAWEKATSSWAVQCCSSIRQNGNACGSCFLQADQLFALQTLHLLYYEFTTALPCCLVMWHPEEKIGSCVDSITWVRAYTRTQTHTHHVFCWNYKMRASQLPKKEIWTKHGPNQWLVFASCFTVVQVCSKALSLSTHNPVTPRQL